MGTQIVITAETLPDGTCYATEQERLDGTANNLQAELEDTILNFTVSETTPSVDDQDKIWIQLDGSGNINGEFKYVDGEWTAARNPFPPNFVQAYYGSSIDVPTLHGGTTLNPFWRVCDGSNSTPDLRGRFILGQGTLPDSSTIVGLGDTGGEELHTLIPAEAGQLNIITVTDDGDAQTGSFGSAARISINGIEALAYGTGGNVTTNTQAFPNNQTPHQNMPPYVGMLYIIRTSRLF